jgi:hypothetical protein
MKPEIVHKFGGGAVTFAIVQFSLFSSLSHTFSCVIPLEKVHSLGYLMVMVWLPGLILSFKD